MHRITHDKTRQISPCSLWSFVIATPLAVREHFQEWTFAHQKREVVKCVDANHNVPPPLLRKHGRGPKN